MSKWTPGPWQVWDRGIGWEVHDSDGVCINSGHRGTFYEPDARLIAAAPEMAELLEQAAYLLAFHARKSGSKIDTGVVGEARALLAKVNG